jgi:ribosomal protein S12 methylthiotransferase accessory factor YcaO
MFRFVNYPAAPVHVGVVRTALDARQLFETIGSVLVAYVGVRAAILELLIGRYFAPRNRSSSDVDKVGNRLEHLYDRRKSNSALLKQSLSVWARNRDQFLLRHDST